MGEYYTTLIRVFFYTVFGKSVKYLAWFDKNGKCNLLFYKSKIKPHKLLLSLVLYLPKALLRITSVLYRTQLRIDRGLYLFFISFCWYFYLKFGCISLMLCGVYMREVNFRERFILKSAYGICFSFFHQLALFLR